MKCSDDCQSPIHISVWWREAQDIVGKHWDVSVATFYSRQGGARFLITVPGASFCVQRDNPMDALDDLRKAFRSKHLRLIS